MNHSMILNEGQIKVLLEIGKNPKTNAYEISNKLNRDQGGTNRLCAGLLQKGLITKTKELNEKKSSVNKFELTLPGFSHVIVGQYGRSTNTQKENDDFNKDIETLLNSCQDLHEGIGFFYDLFRFTIENEKEEGAGHFILLRMGRPLKYVIDDVEWMKKPYLYEEIVQQFSKALYAGVFFELWNTFYYLNGSKLSTISKHFHDEVLPKYVKSEGRDLILDALESQEKRYEKLKDLKAFFND